MIHRLDPRVKLVGCLVYLVSLFLFDSFAGLLVALCFLAGIIFLSKVSLRYILKGLRPILFLLLITVIFNFFLTPGETLVKWWIFRITKEGLYRGAFVGARLIFLILGSSMLTFTTTPMELTEGLERLMHPLTFIKVPVHDLATMMSIALRFIPILIEETDRIMKAQQARGVDFATGGIMTRVKAAVPIMVPLFLSAFRRADELALAMEARCYRGGVGRTQMKALKVTRLDCIAAALMLAMAAGLALLAWWG